MVKEQNFVYKIHRTAIVTTDSYKHGYKQRNLSDTTISIYSE